MLALFACSASTPLKIQFARLFPQANLSPRFSIPYLHPFPVRSVHEAMVIRDG